MSVGLMAHVARHFDVVYRSQASKPPAVILLGYVVKVKKYNDAIEKVVEDYVDPRTDALFMQAESSWKVIIHTVKPRLTSFGWNDPRALNSYYQTMRCDDDLDKAAGLVASVQRLQTQALVDTLKRYRTAPFYDRVFVLGSPLNLKPLPSVADHPALDLSSLHEELNNHSAVIAFPKGVLSQYYSLFLDKVEGTNIETLDI